MKPIPQNKCCTKCHIVKPINEFGKQSCKSSGIRPSCKQCNREYRLSVKERKAQYDLKYRAKNKTKIKQYQDIYNINHRIKILECSSLYYKQNKNKILIRQIAYNLKKTNSDISYKIAKRLRTRLWHALKGDYKSGSAVRDLGCSIEQYKTYLESKFYRNIQWDNYGKVWQIDHIIPLSKFDLTNRNQFLKACHYSNTQPLLIFDNLSKGSSYV